MKKIPEHEVNVNQRGNYDAHSGYECCELFIDRKYDSFKKEMMNYNYAFSDIKQVHFVIDTANAYLQDSDTVKAIQAKGNETSTGRIPPYYEIAEGSPLKSEHLTSILCYTDYTDHSTSFSNSFRKTNPFENLESIKRRNSQYFWMAKYLREAVEIYGGCSYDAKKLRGPFFTGISTVIDMPYFHIRLCAPTSTSRQIEVSMKFSGEGGMILQLNNPVQNHRCMYLRGFDVCAISRYREEDEVYVIFLALLLTVHFL